MKKLLFTLCLYLLASFYLNAQTNTFPTSGNVGIGTINPSSIVHIKGSQDNILTFQTSDTSWLYTNWLDNTNTRRLWMGLGVDLSSFNISVENGTNKILLNGGNVGIGTTDPTSNLHISSNHNPQFQLRSELQGLWTTVNDDTNEITFNSSFYTGGSYPIVFQMGNIEKLRITSDGKLGIGTSNPDAKLTVKGNIHTNEVKVDLLGAVAPDYVFYKDYDLKSLKAVEDYITSNGHLPNIPSAKDMENDGIMLKEMNLKLLEKIEELTLYAIQQEKKLKKVELLEEELQNQKVINKDLLEKFTSQETRLQTIEALLNSKKQ